VTVIDAEAESESVQARAEPAGHLQVELPRGRIRIEGQVAALRAVLEILSR
jgi:hypothetical protein